MLTNWLIRCFRKQSITHILKQADTSTSHRVLSVWDLTSFGVAAIVGAGIFSTIGTAAAQGGPAVIILFLLTAVVCGFAALCYAEFASQIPISGSAYTYAYATFGELFAWIIGWDLLMEYAISNIAVAISWGEYLLNFLAGYGIQIPPYLTTDYLTASRGYQEVLSWVQQGHSVLQVDTVFPQATLHAFHAWAEAPRLGPIPFICNLPVLGVTALVTAIAYLGIQGSKRISNALVIVKILVILLVIGIGIFYVQPSHWVPFAPHGFHGILEGLSGVFFAYIGFDAISTTAEECKNPQRDLPRGMAYALIICTVLYILVALILTGIVPFHELNVGDPLAYIFGPQGINIPWLSQIISMSAVIALFTVLLVYQIGQPRIWMAMSRDGLLPPLFSAMHARYKTPWFSTLLTGVLVSVPSLFMNLNEVTSLCSIGTLFTFALVCAGVLNLKTHARSEKGFRIPYVNSQYYFPIISIVIFLLTKHFHPLHQMYFISNFPMCFYSAFMLGLNILCYVKKFSLIPILGLSSCSYLITALGTMNWIRFGIWLVVGLIIYFLYGFKNSKLNQK